MPKRQGSERRGPKKQGPGREQSQKPQAPSSSRPRKATGTRRPAASTHTRSTAQSMPVQIVVQDGLAPSFEALCARLTARLPSLEGRLQSAPADTLEAALAGEGAVLSVQTPPLHSLAMALASSDDTGLGLASWLAEQRSRLAVLRRNRRRLTLVTTDLLGADSAHEDWEALARRLGVEDAPTPQSPATPSPDALLAPAIPSAVQLAAATLAQTDPETQEILAELALATIGQPQEDYRSVVAQSLQDWRDSSLAAQNAEQTMSAQIDTLEATLRTQAKAAEDQLSAVQAAHAEETKALQSEQTRLQTELETALQSYAEASNTADGLRMQLTLLEENLSAQIEHSDDQLRAAQAAQTTLADELKTALETGADATQIAATLQQRLALMEENLTAQIEHDDLLLSTSGALWEEKFSELEASRATLEEELGTALQSKSDANKIAETLQQRLALLEENLTAQIEESDRKHHTQSASHAAQLVAMETSRQALSAELETVLQTGADATKVATNLQQRLSLMEENLTEQLAHTREQAASVMDAQVQKTLGLEARLGAVTASEHDAHQKLSLTLEQQDLMAEHIELARAASDKGQRDLTAQAQSLRHSLDQATAQADVNAQMAQAERTARRSQIETLEHKQACRDAAIGAKLLDALDTVDTQSALIGDLTNELDKVYGSRSWRMTGPFRGVRSRVRPRSKQNTSQ